LRKDTSAGRFREISGNITVAMPKMMYAVATGHQSFYISSVFISWLAEAAASDGREQRKFFPEMPNVIVCATRRTRTLQVHERAGRVSVREID
jgi:hypothetical protein